MYSWDSAMALPPSAVRFLLLLSSLPYLFIYWPVVGHLGCFQALDIVNQAVINIFVRGFVWTYVFILLGKYLSVARLYGKYNFLFKKQLELFPK